MQSRPTLRSVDAKPADPGLVAFGALVRRHRAMHHQSQEAFAALFPVRPQTVSGWENARLRPQPRFHRRIAEVLGLARPDDVRAILAGEGVASEPRDALGGAIADLAAARTEIALHVSRRIDADPRPTGRELEILEALASFLSNSDAGGPDGSA